MTCGGAEMGDFGGEGAAVWGRAFVSGECFRRVYVDRCVEVVVLGDAAALVVKGGGEH